MSITRMRVSALAAALLGVLVGAAPAAAQGTTTGAISGRVTEAGGAPVANAQVQVRNEATGFSNGALTRADGRYTVLGLEVGSYTVTARRIGFEATTVNGVRVTLSQTTQQDITLRTQAAQLEAVTVTADQGSGAVISPSRTGAATTVTDSALRRLPTLNRNFTDFVQLTPQVSNSGPGLSGGGTNNRFNNIQIDGATESDLFGLGSTGQPGGQAGGKSIGIESVKEYQVLLSPYDVRQGNFSGVLINAVTKSGANELFGSVYAYGRDQRLVRDQPYIQEFQQTQYGFSLGGPIVRDRVLFFVNPEIQRRDTPAGGTFFGDPRLASDRISSVDLQRFRDALAARGYTDLGNEGAVTINNPLTNVFGRLDFNLGRSQLVLRHNYGRAEDQNFSRSNATGSFINFPLTSNLYEFSSVKNATVGQLRTQFGNGAFNELIVGYTTIRDARATPGTRIAQVAAEFDGGQFVAGTERFSQANELDQDVIEVTNNFTLPLGAHRVTIGTQNQFYKVRNLFAQSSVGAWTFETIADLEAGNPEQYIIGVPVTGDGAVRFTSAQYAGYVQDEWQASDNFRLSLGVRLDVPTFGDRPPFNPAVEADFGRDTREIPTGNLQWSPRVGFNWDVTGDQTNQLRGGVGVFVGRPAFVWLSNAFQNSGVSGVGLLTCVDADAPRFTAENVATPPTQCANGRSASAGSEINLLSEDLSFPQNLRATLGYDRDLGEGLVLTLEGLYTRGLNNLFYQNIALSSQNGIGTGANGRTVFGTRPNNPTLAVDGRRTVLDVTNQSEDYAYSLTAGLTRRFRDNWEGSFFYTYGRAYDVQSLSSSTAFSQYRFGRVYAGAASDQSVTPSRFDQPQRLVATGTYSFPTKTDVSLIWIGESGARYDYITNLDLNGDGLTLNDPIYVPNNALDPNEILFRDITSGFGANRVVVATEAEQRAAFEGFIRETPCLRENRGRILPRLECREPFSNRVDLSVRQSLSAFAGQNLTLALDVINFGNLLQDHWGRRSLTPGQTPVTLLSSSGVESGVDLNAGARGIYTFNPSTRRFAQEFLSSNYQMQLSVRYSF